MFSFPSTVHRPGAVALALVLGIAPAWSQAPGLSYERALSLALERAPMVLARQAAVDGAALLRTPADQLPDPKLTVGVDNFPVGGPDRYSLVRDGMTQRSVGWMQDMPNSAKRAARVLGAQARSERERALLDAERLGVQREVAQAWLARLYAERQLAQFAALEAENRLLRETVESRIANGKSAPGDATMARQETLALADRRDELVRDRARAQATLESWVGPEAAQPLSGSAPVAYPRAAVLQQGIERQADLRPYEAMQRMTEAEAQELEAAKRGDWNWQVAYSRRGPGYGDMVSFQFAFEIPLAPAQRQDPQIAAKRKEADRIAAERDEALRRRRDEIGGLLAELDETDRKLQRLQAAARPLADERVALAMAAYESARGDLAAVLAARRERAELGLRALDLEGRQQTLRARLSFYTVPETQP